MTVTIKQAETEAIVDWMNTCSVCGNPLEQEYGELLILKIEGKSLLHSICHGGIENALTATCLWPRDIPTKLFIF
jgi:hypothetical protein